MTAFGWIHFFFLLQGVLWTLALFALAIVLGSVGGFAVMLLRISRTWFWRWLSFLLVQLVQGTPLLIIFFLVFFGLSAVGIEVHGLVAAAVALMIYCSAFLGEIWRGSIQAVARTQSEAAECLGLSRWRTLIDVILPQAMRIATPPTVGFMVQVLKGTSLASVIGFVEVTRAAQLVNNTIYQPFLVFGVAAGFYFALCYPLSLWSRALERKLNVGRSQSL